MGSSDAFGALTAFKNSAASFKRFAPKHELRPTVLHNAGNALLDLNRVDEALGYYKDALAMGPTSCLVYNGLSNGYETAGRYDEARTRDYHVITM